MSAPTFPTILVFGTDFDFNDQVSIDFGYDGFEVLSTHVPDIARAWLRERRIDIVVLPFAWSAEKDPETSRLLDEKKPILVTSEGIVRLPRPSQMIPILRRSLMRREETDVALGKMLYFIQGNRPKDPQRRHRLDLPLELRWAKDDFTLELSAKTFNVSATGFFVSTDAGRRSPSVGERFSFALRATDSRIPPIYAHAKVIWTRTDFDELQSPRARILTPAGFGAEILRR